MHQFIDFAEAFMSGLLRFGMLFRVCDTLRSRETNILLTITLLI